MLDGSKTDGDDDAAAMRSELNDRQAKQKNKEEMLESASDIWSSSWSKTWRQECGA